MLDKDIKEIKKIVTSRGYNRFVFVEHLWRQLKLSNEWYEEQCSLVSYNPEVIMREIELKRIHGSTNSPFKRSDIIYLMNHVKEPIKQIDYSKNLCPILIYEKLKINKVYMLCVDPSEGLAQDNNAMTLIDPVTRRAVAEFQSPYISQPEFCKLLCHFLDDFCPRSVIIIESNKGRELINRFLETKYKYQVYYDDGKLGDKVIEKTDPYGRLKQAAMQRRAYGVWTGGTNRSQYFGILENIVEESKDLLLTKYLVADVCGLIRKPNGRVEAGDGNHDDNIMSYLIGLYVYTFATYEKLEEYGIRRGASDSFYGDDEYSTDDYDESGQLTEQGQLKQLAAMLPSLPENMQEVVRAALAQQDPVKDSQRFYREVQSARNRFNIDTPDMEQQQPNEDFIPSEAPLDQSHWAEYDRNIWGSNDPSGGDPTDPFGFGNFDMEDYLGD